MNELAVKASNEVLSDSARSIINQEFIELKKEMDSVSESVDFNGIKLLDGTLTSISVNVGLEKSVEISGLISVNSAEIGVGGSSSKSINEISLLDASDSLDAVKTIGQALSQVIASRAKIASSQNRLEATQRANEVISESLNGARSRIRDTDVAAETARLAKYDLLQSSGSKILVKTNSLPYSVVSALLR
jgi:flagellin